MNVLLDIPDNEPRFALKVLNSMTFVKKIKPASLTSAELWGALKEAFEDVQLHKQGKLKLKSAQELLNEL